MDYKRKRYVPNCEQIDLGQVNFLRNGNGTDFASDPSTLYQKAFGVNGGLNYSESTEYYVRVAGVYEDGATPISYAASTIFPLEAPPLF